MSLPWTSIDKYTLKSRDRHENDQPLDCSLKSPRFQPGSPDSYCSHSSAWNSKKSSSNGPLIRDEQYRQRREKNNAAAKRSRDARRQKEEHTKLENQILREENEKLRNELNRAMEHIQVCKLIK